MNDTQEKVYGLLENYLEYCKEMSAIFALKCVGKDDEANKAFARFTVNFGKYELEMERWYDHCLATGAFGTMMGKIDLQAAND